MSAGYFDHAASAPRRDEVFAAMAPFMHGIVGNPSGTHRAARASRRAIEEARDEIATFAGIEPGGVIFTGGGTESCHLAVSGVVHAFRRRATKSEIVTSPVEHHAILESAESLARDHEDVTMRTIRVDGDGVVELDSLEELLNERTALVSVMTANNETGVVEPLSAVGDVVRERAPQAVTHTDAVAAAHWLDLADVTNSIDLVSICAHKLGGPVNAGALLVRGPVTLEPVVAGGGQERGRRGGTVDVAAAVGLAAAVRLCASERNDLAVVTRHFQERMIAAFVLLDGVTVTARDARRLPGHVHVTVDGAASDEILFLLDQAGICAAAASSCASGAGIASHVLFAMGIPATRARGAIRFTMGYGTTDDDVQHCIEVFSRIVEKLRAN